MGGKLKIHVIYCAACGYGPRFEKLRADLERIFPRTLDITHDATWKVTGYFEVQIVNGKLLHSKKNGHGYVDDSVKMNRIVQGIKDALRA